MLVDDDSVSNMAKNIKVVMQHGHVMLRGRGSSAEAKDHILEVLRPIAGLRVDRHFDVASPR